MELREAVREGRQGRNKDTQEGWDQVDPALSWRRHSISEAWGVCYIQLDRRQAWLLHTAEQGGGVCGIDEQGGTLSVGSSFQAGNIQEGENLGGHFLPKLSTFTLGLEEGGGAPMGLRLWFS